MPDNNQSVLSESTRTQVENFVESKAPESKKDIITKINTAPKYSSGKINDGLTMTKIVSIVDDFEFFFGNFWGKDIKKYPIWGSLTLILENLECFPTESRASSESLTASAAKNEKVEQEVAQEGYTKITFEILDTLRESIVVHKWAKDYIANEAIQVRDRLSTVYVEIAYGLAEVMEFLSATSHTAKVERKDWEPILEKCHQRAHRARKALKWVELDALFSTIVREGCKCSSGRPGPKPQGN